MTNTYAHPTRRPAHGSLSFGFRDLVLAVALSIIFAPVGLIVLGAA